MKHTAGIRHYFMEAFTPNGYISLLGETLKEAKYAYILAGGPATGKSTMIKLIGIQLIDRGYDVDYIRSSREPDSVAGLYLPKSKLCLLNENEFVSQTKLNLQNYKKVGFDSICRPSKLEEHEGKITELTNILDKMEDEIVQQLKIDYPLHSQDENTTVPFRCLFQESNTIVYNEATEILSKVRKNCLSYCFLHALQVDGWLNLAPRYIKDYDRICLEGGDSSQILIDILQEVSCLGQVMELIVNPLQPDTVLGIVFPEKNLAVWQGNPARIEEQGFKQAHSEQLLAILEQYKSVRMELKNLINDTVSFPRLDSLRSELLSRILSDLVICP
ncbi:MAG: hypothetical protein GX248_11450 [Peptococcaceae bacterium]|nr:hypothetical protein [Peptococcaceae bacterium]